MVISETCMVSHGREVPSLATVECRRLDQWHVQQQPRPNDLNCILLPFYCWSLLLVQDSSTLGLHTIVQYSTTTRLYDSYLTPVPLYPLHPTHHTPTIHPPIHPPQPRSAPPGAMVNPFLSALFVAFSLPFLPYSMR